MIEKGQKKESFEEIIWIIKEKRKKSRMSQSSAVEENLGSGEGQDCYSEGLWGVAALVFVQELVPVNSVHKRAEQL